MLVKIEARILIFPGTNFHFPSTSVPPGTFLGSVYIGSQCGRMLHATARFTRSFSTLASDIFSLTDGPHQ